MMITDEFIIEFINTNYEDIKPLKDKKFTPTYNELKILYNDNKCKIKNISKLYGWTNSNKISQLIDEYGFEKWHLDFEFKPNSHEIFINDLKTTSISEMARKYNVDRSKISKYIKKNNIKINYFNDLSSLECNDLIKMLSQDFIFNIAKIYNVSPYELKRKLKTQNIDIFDIELDKDIIVEKLIEFVNNNPTYEGKTITHEKRLYNYVMNKTKEHILDSDKITERVYRIVNNYSHDQVDKCVHCQNKLKFYTTVLGYGNSDNKICEKCICGYLGIGASKSSQELFESVYNHCDFLNSNNTHYANLNYEFKVDIDYEKGLIFTDTNKKFYRVDFLYNDKIIEFDGEYWHSDDSKETSKDLYLESVGYTVLHIKHSEYIYDKQKEINKCIEFLKRE